MASQEPDTDRHKDQAGTNDANTFAASLVGQVNQEDIPQMVYIQRDMLGRFEKTNEMLINFNMLSSGRYEATVTEFQKHTQLLFDMKKDLNSIFRRIRVVKSRLEKSYPDAFAACSHTYTVASDDEEEEDVRNEERTRPRAKTEITNTYSIPAPLGAASRERSQSEGHILSHRGVDAHRGYPASKSISPVVNVIQAENATGTSQTSKTKSRESLPES
ncbi:kxDL motif-containing protein 1-like [Elysia marginata]|uniref:KxDL motif-containing protein 1-like n=1 Tax=Elysia marginata TaxID=1093978 RepID=A0AAV4J0S8_9GAST|nr:kxDL motif-containing protein 1-like [Elysia marginata]